MADIRVANVVTGEEKSLSEHVRVKCVSCGRTGQVPYAAVHGLKPDEDGVHTGMCPNCYMREEVPDV